MPEARRKIRISSGSVRQMDRARVVSTVLRWYDDCARDLPWRHPDASPWSIMVSEFMLQQTPVERVLRPWQEWMDRWPTPSALAHTPSGEAVRAWGRLGYPRRALRLHQSAVVISEQHDDQVPDDHDALLALPGVGSYTAAAILSFAYGQRHVVLDTNVRRVLARVSTGAAYPSTATTVAERSLAETFLPRRRDRAARWAVASMELGALVCTARGPRCESCPIRNACTWYAEGRPAWDGPPRKGQSYAGTDRQCRGVLLAAVRSSDMAVPREEALRRWPDPSQAERALASLHADGLVVALPDDTVTLPF